jgi:hypothetical protein
MKKQPSIIQAFVTLLFACAIAAIGCSRSGPQSVTVTGDVVYRGKPVEDASILFVPVKNRTAVGRTDDQGRFTLKAFVANDGSESDEQVICVAKMIDDPRAKKSNPVHRKMSILPHRYSTPVQSPLRATVTSHGTNEFHFELTD